MQVQTCTTKNFTKVQPYSGHQRNTAGQIKDIFSDLITKQPVVATATSLTLVGFVASFSAKSRLVFISGVGITSIAMFIYHIFNIGSNSTQNSNQLSLNEQNQVAVKEAA